MYLPVRLLVRQDQTNYIDMLIDGAPLQEAARSAAAAPDDRRPRSEPAPETPTPAAAPARNLPPEAGFN
jgi:hypothetical protein